uniref:pre-B-cell leukemia homeobox interacting protein 1b isoform X2 n=1 Tax=Monopterus albus TaxID=43700 RepID=UPI0009B470DA|nr:pre-B-cell leukemia transcription factor-interacting protein 1-like isoform X2 [Monopterus albus]
MSGGTSSNNSWTILTPEETVAETLKPLAERAEHHEESLMAAAAMSVFDEPGAGLNQPTKGVASTVQSPVEGHLVSEPSGDTGTEPTTSLDVSSSSVPGNNALGHSEGLPEGLAESSSDPDLFSDSCTHVTPSSDEPPAFLLSTETLGEGQFTQEEQKLAEEETLHLLSGAESQQEGEASNVSQRITDLGTQADSPVYSEVGEEKIGEEGEPEVRKRRFLLANLEQIGRTEEEEEVEEEFQMPRRVEEGGFSLNKCILGALILLGLGTIFFSGVFMDLDEESDYGTGELKASEVPGKQELLSPEVPPSPVEADREILNKLAKGSQQISVLQAQLQAQEEELKVAKGQAAEGAKQRLLWEEMERENSRLKTEMASLTVLQKENEKMKRELDSMSALQRELETLRSTVTELKLSSASEASEAPVKMTTSPPSGQPEDTRQGTAGSAERQARKLWDDQKQKKKNGKKDKYDTGEKNKWKETEKVEWKEGEKRDYKDVGKSEWKKEKHEQGKTVKDTKGKHKSHSDETKQWREKDWKKEKASRGDEGKPWKARKEEKEQVEKSERKEWKEERDQKKAKHGEVNEGKQWRTKVEKDWEQGNDHGEKHKGKEEWKGEKEWKKVKDGSKESGKEKRRNKDWKEKGEKREWKSKNGNNPDKEGKEEGERKLWEESKNHGKERKRKDEGKQWGENEWRSKTGKHDKEGERKDERKHWGKKEEWKRAGAKEREHSGEWNKDGSSSQQHKDEHKFTSKHYHEEHVWGDGSPPQTHHRPSLDQPEYWVQQRDHLQHILKPPQHCNSVETCAQAEGLIPVPLFEFEVILQTYLAKAEEVGVEAFKREELMKLVTEFFKDGVFVHDQMQFQEFVEEVSDILEHMVEEDENEEEEDSAIEEEMEEFEREVMKRFSAPGARERKRVDKEWKKENGRGHG